MSLTVNAKTYTADRISPDAVVYNGPAHTMSVLDDIKLSRTAAKPTSSFSGVQRYYLDCTRTHTLTGALTATASGSFKSAFNLPVGIASADVDAYCNDLGAYIASAAFKTLVKAATINS